MNDDCTGYACPPSHSVPASEVIVVRTHEHDALAGTGGHPDPTLPILAVLAIIIGAALTRRRARRNT